MTGTVAKGIERICGRTFSASTDAIASKLANAYAANGLNSICSKYLLVDIYIMDFAVASETLRSPNL